MNQIIVNVDGLTIEEKKHVSEALAKIKNVRMCNPLYWDVVVLLYGPSYDGVNVGFGYYEAASPTHTPQQVLEMAGMAPATDPHVFLADMLIITDSSGSIIYDSTLGATIKKRANPGKGVSVKLDKNGAAVMVEKRKVRAGFDKTKEYSVDASMCSEEEKKEVQQAFFDVGIVWAGGGTEYQHLDKVQYTNTTGCGQVTTDCMFGNTTEDCNMTAKEFLELVYEPEQQGHVHADSLALYAEDAKTHAEPWKLWQMQIGSVGPWFNCEQCNMVFVESNKYRRKPTTHIVNGVEIPDLRVKPEVGDYYYLACPIFDTLFTRYKCTENSSDKLWFERGLTYQHTEEGKQAAILHSKAMLGMVQ